MNRVSRLVIGVAAVAAAWMYPTCLLADVTATINDAGQATLDPPPHSPIESAGEWNSSIDGERSLWIRLEDGTVLQCVTGPADPNLPGGRVIVTGYSSEWIRVAAAFPLATTSVVRTDLVGSRRYQLVTGLAAWQPDPADFNLDRQVNQQDVFDFLEAWFDSSPAADLNGSAACDLGDVFDFLHAWCGSQR